MKYTGRWTARVEQDFEVEADSREEAEKLVEEEMNPRRVVELLDLEVEWDADPDDTVFVGPAE